jgi:TonB family protein
MTRLQKKCFFVSVGLHGLLLLILLGSSAFRDKPEAKDIPILTMIPANILDKAGAGGGSPEPAAAAQPAQPAPPVVQTPQPVAQQRVAEPLEHPKSREVERQPEPKPVERQQETPPEAKPEPAKEAETKPAHKTHEVHPTFDPVTPLTRNKTKTKTSEAATTESSTAADNSRLQRQVARAMEAMANHVKDSGAKGTVVDMPGQGGGEAFAGYETVIYNAYYHAWITPDSVADKLAATDVKIVVARDGTILSAEIVNPSSERALDKSVERALRAVRSLPPFPATAHDEQRSFLIRFNLEAKEGSG